MVLIRHGSAVQISSFRSSSQSKVNLGMMFTLFGLLLVIPNALTLLTLGLGVVLIQIQVRLEEEFLATTHGEEYTLYRIRVRRWI